MRPVLVLREVCLADALAVRLVVIHVQLLPIMSAEYGDLVADASAYHIAGHELADVGPQLADVR